MSLVTRLPPHLPPIDLDKVSLSDLRTLVDQKIESFRKRYRILQISKSRQSGVTPTAPLGDMIRLPFRDHPLPLQDRKLDNPPKTRRVKAMTIGIAMQVEEGIVLCADRLMAHGGGSNIGSFAHYESKTYGAEGKYFGVSLVAAAEDAGQIRPFAESFLKQMQLAESDDADSLPHVETILKKELNQLSTQLDAIPSLNLLVGYVEPPRRIQLLKSNGLVVGGGGPLEIIGIGEESLLRYLTDLLFTPKLTLNEAKTFAVYLVYLAKKYCPQYCGGDTDVQVLKPSYELRDFMTKAEVKGLEEFFATNAKRHLHALLKAATELL